MSSRLCAESRRKSWRRIDAFVVASGSDIECAIPQSRRGRDKPAGTPSMANTEPKPKLIHAAAGALLARYIRFVARSSRQTQEMTERFERHCHHHPCVVAMWHGQFMLLPLIKRPGFEADVMLARHRDAELMGAVLATSTCGSSGAPGAGGREQGSRRRARLQGGRADAARGALGRHDGRRARQRRGAARGPRHRHDRAPGGAADHADGDRHLALHRVQQLEPHDHQSAVVGPGLRGGQAGARAARRRWRPTSSSYRQAVEESLNAATALAYERADADAARATPGRVSTGRTEPGLRLKAYRTLTSLARPVAPLLLRLRERRGKEEPARRHERLGQPSAPRPHGPLVWFHAASVGETNCHPAADVGAGRAAPLRSRSCSPPAP